MESLKYPSIDDTVAGIRYLASLDNTPGVVVNILEAAQYHINNAHAEFLKNADIEVALNSDLAVTSVELNGSPVRARIRTYSGLHDEADPETKRDENEAMYQEKIHVPKFDISNIVPLDRPE